MRKKGTTREGTEYFHGEQHTQGFRVTIGSVSDVKVFIPLFKDSLSILRRTKMVEYLIGDAAYDSIEEMEGVKV